MEPDLIGIVATNDTPRLFGQKRVVQKISQATRKRNVRVMPLHPELHSNTNPGPPTWPEKPLQDSYGNPTTKKPGDVGTDIKYSHSHKTSYGGHPYRDMSGRFGSKGKDQPTKDYKARLPRGK